MEIGDGHRFDVVALLGNQLVFHTTVRAHKEDAASGVLLLEDMGQGYRRIHMPGGAAAGKQNIHRCTSQSFLGAGICREILSIMPISASWITRAVPP